MVLGGLEVGVDDCKTYPMTNNKITIPTHIPKKCEIPFNTSLIIYIEGRLFFVKYIYNLFHKYNRLFSWSKPYHPYHS